ncbi:MAG: M14 family zinc carboxypeptidase [Acidobacteria bacterium]|nr:M14 family zinc carboxypeptidase [Acidobacteriota bacterium]
MHGVRRTPGIVLMVLVACVLVFGANGQSAAPQGRPGASPVQKNDDDYTKRILDNTPDKRILTELVDHMPVSATVPSPLKFLGYVPGENSRLTYHKDIVAYYQALVKATARATMWEIGKTEEGRPVVALAVADEATIKSLDKYKRITAQLTDPRKLSEEQARLLIQTGKPIYYATGSIHSPETGSPEMLMELAFRLAVEETPFIKQIRNNIIVVITPVSEVDGHERQVDNRRAADAGQPQPGMTYWGKYVAHDNNRDGIGKGLALSQNMLKSFLDLHPQVMHDLHESVTLLYASTGTGPYFPSVAPIQVTEWWWLAETEIMEMTKRGVPGVWTYNYYDGWVPNYMFWIGVGHNSIGRFYETQSYGGGGGRGGAPAASGAAATGATPPAGGRAGGAATPAGGRAGAPAAPATQAPGAPAAAGGRSVGGGQSREWYRPYPVPPEGVQWSGRANINMQESAILIAMNAVAKNREMFLENYYLKNKMMVEQGRTRAPHAYVIPAQQHRRIDAVDFMNFLRREAVEIHTATAPFTIGKVQVAAGDYIVRLDQPYGGLADMLLGVQWYPEQNPRPYDDTGWSLPLLRNVQTFRVDDKAIFDKPMTLATADFKAAGTITGTGGTFVIEHTTDSALATFRFANAKVRMTAAEQPFDLAGHHFGAGAFIIPAANRALLEPQIRDYGLLVWATDTPPSVPTHDLDVPRIGYVHSWSSTQDEGWVRMVLDKIKVPYTYFGDNLLRQGRLRAKYDVIIYPNGPVTVDGGEIPTDGTPLPYKKTDLTPNIGTAPDSTDDRRGSLGRDGLKALEAFVQEGGVLIAEGTAATLFPEYRLVPGVTIEQPSGLYAPGSVIKALIGDKTSPILYGYDQNTIGVMYKGGPVLALGGGGGGRGDGGGRGGTLPAGVGGGNLQPMATPPRLTTLDAAPAAAAPAGAEGRGGRGGRGGGRGGFGGGAAVVAPPRVLLSYPTDPNDLLLSGELVGGENLVGRPALVDAPLGKGHLVLFGVRPFWRYETHGSFFFALNAMLNWNHLDAGRKAAGAPAGDR